MILEASIFIGFMHIIQGVAPQLYWYILDLYIAYCRVAFLGQCSLIMPYPSDAQFGLSIIKLVLAESSFSVA